MAAKHEKSTLKRALRSQDDTPAEPKKPRRSDRLKEPGDDGNGVLQQLPSPLTYKESTATEVQDGTVTPPSQRPNFFAHPRADVTSQIPGLNSPPSDTQAYSQFIYPPQGLSHEVKDEGGEGVWGYLLPLDSMAGETLVLRQRAACPAPSTPKAKKMTGKEKVHHDEFKGEEERYEEHKVDGVPAGGYLIGRHPECDRKIDAPTISNRHCLVFHERKGGDTVAILEDLSGNGTFINEALVGRNKRRELSDGDEVSIVDEARFIFRYPRSRQTNGFGQQFALGEQLGKGHFASVYLATEKNSGLRYAVKKFEKRKGSSERSKVEGLQQEIAVLMGVSHPSLLCLKDTFDEDDGVYLVLELAPEGELFNWIVMKQKLTETEARKVFVQLFQGVKYLHERNIVHRDIKPENILLADKNLHVKLADFGLAKIIGEESFTTTLCGTPSYVAPEILESSGYRRYTRAVDVWSLGVVLYICLCGFPPFSDELYSRENPYTLSQQIKMGRFDYPSPYWDSVGDPALDLIDRMLTVDVEKRATIDECLEHPWTTQREITLNDSTDGLTGAMGQLDFSKRKVHRERTLLSSLNEVKVTNLVDGPGEMTVNKYEKNPKKKKTKKREESPTGKRNVEEFAVMGGKGDQTLFGEDSKSMYGKSTPV